MEEFRKKHGYLCDMDGVIYHGNRLLPGVKEFVDWLYREKKQFLFLTNNSGKTPRELQDKLARMGLEVDEKHFYTSALATAEFISSQVPGAKAYVVGEPGLYNALYDRGITLSDVNPDYVVIGETPNYNYDAICIFCCFQESFRLVSVFAVFELDQFDVIYAPLFQKLIFKIKIQNFIRVKVPLACSPAVFYKQPFLLPTAQASSNAVS